MLTYSTKHNILLIIIQQNPHRIDPDVFIVTMTIRRRSGHPDLHNLIFISIIIKVSEISHFFVINKQIYHCDFSS